MEQHAVLNEEQRFYRDLGDAIRRLRIQQNLTQEDVAHRLGLTRTSVTNIERGNQKILAHTLVAAAGVFGVQPTDLLEGQRNSLVHSMPAELPSGARAWIENIAIKLEQG